MYGSSHLQFPFDSDYVKTGIISHSCYRTLQKLYVLVNQWNFRIFDIKMKPEIDVWVSLI